MKIQLYGIPLNFPLYGGTLKVSYTIILQLPFPSTFSGRWSKTNISLVPRAVARGKSESDPGNQQAPSGTRNGEPATRAKVSNDDFRKLLSKN